MNIELDMHTHTLASGHAYSTIREMAKAASEKGLKLLGITEHAPGIPGTCDSIYFRNIKVVPREMYGVKIMFGSEINIIDYEGNLSLEQKAINALDIRIAGIHYQCYKFGNIEENTNAVVSAIKNPDIDIISHPDDGRCPLDYETVVMAAKEYNTFLELNNNSLNPINKRKNVVQNVIEMLNLCKEHEVPIIMGSDAHVDVDVARYDFASKMIKEVDFPEELIINRSAKEFMKRIKLNRKQKMVAV